MIFFIIRMGRTGNQSLDFAQNKTLYESDTNGVDVFLFEAFEEKKYVYQGRVKLAHEPEPYQEKQLDINGNIRDVWIFPLKLVDQSPAIIPEEVFQKQFSYREKLAKKLSTEDLRRRISTAPRKPGVE